MVRTSTFVAAVASSISVVTADVGLKKDGDAVFYNGGWCKVPTTSYATATVTRTITVSGAKASDGPKKEDGTWTHPDYKGQEHGGKDGEWTPYNESDEKWSHEGDYYGGWYPRSSMIGISSPSPSPSKGSYDHGKDYEKEEVVECSKYDDGAYYDDKAGKWYKPKPYPSYKSSSSGKLVYSSKYEPSPEPRSSSVSKDGSASLTSSASSSERSHGSVISLSSSGFHSLHFTNSSIPLSVHSATSSSVFIIVSPTITSTSSIEGASSSALSDSASSSSASSFSSSSATISSSESSSSSSSMSSSTASSSASESSSSSLISSSSSSSASVSSSSSSSAASSSVSSSSSSASPSISPSPPPVPQPQLPSCGRIPNPSFEFRNGPDDWSWAEYDGRDVDWHVTDGSAAEGDAYCRTSSLIPAYSVQAFVTFSDLEPDVWYDLTFKYRKGAATAATFLINNQVRWEIGYDAQAPEWTEAVVRFFSVGTTANLQLQHVAQPETDLLPSIMDWDDFRLSRDGGACKASEEPEPEPISDPIPEPAPQPIVKPKCGGIYNPGFENEAFIFPNWVASGIAATGPVVPGFTTDIRQTGTGTAAPDSGSYYGYFWARDDAKVILTNTAFDLVAGREYTMGWRYKKTTFSQVLVYADDFNIGGNITPDAFGWADEEVRFVANGPTASIKFEIETTGGVAARVYLDSFFVVTNEGDCTASVPEIIGLA